MGRMWILENDPERQEEFARLVHEGHTRDAIASAFEINPETVTAWRKRPQIAALIKRMNDDRENRIVSKVDSRLMAALDNNDQLDVKTLLEIRRTIDGTRVKNTATGDAAVALAELMKAVNADPDLAAKLRELGVGVDDAA